MNSLLVVLLPALIAVESGGDPLAVGDHGRAIGVLQLHAEYVADVNRIYGKSYRWPEDCRDKKTSMMIAALYLSYWGSEERLGRAATLEDLAKIHHAGPRGWKKDKTNYWDRVKQHL